MNPIGMAKQEKQWQAEDDARTLMRANAILKDKQRLNAAAQVAEKIKKEKIAEAQAAVKVAGMKGGKASSGKHDNTVLDYLQEK